VTVAAPRLLHLNGPPGIGKSTLARMYVDRHPGVLDLDIDQLRTMIGGSHDRFAETGEIVRVLALSMASAHLQTGRDVVLPQYLGRLSEIDRFERVAGESGATFREVVLMDTRERSIERFDRRGEHEGLPWHQAVRAAVASNGGPALLADMYDRLAEVIRSRPGAMVVASVEGAIVETFEALASALDGIDQAPVDGSGTSPSR